MLSLSEEERAARRVASLSVAPGLSGAPSAVCGQARCIAVVRLQKVERTCSIIGTLHKVEKGRYHSTVVSQRGDSGCRGACEGGK